ncbi:MAG: ATP-binding cassette domain-containing protein [Pseudohongiella nitratireducens]|nr:ATP-binding cassette domain-containing protein [Pseudohongiella nitratireducens]
MNPDNNAIVSIRGLSNAFDGRYVHRDLDLDVRPGEILGIVGGSGTGKSVLLRSIVGLQRPVAGEISLFGSDMASANETERLQIRQRIGVLFQQGALFSSLTVTENVSLPLIEHRGLSTRMAADIAAVKIAIAGLPPHAGDLYPADLSGGMIKRAALARALALDPDILFLDEPTAGLDPIGAAAFDQLLLTLRDAFGLTVLMVTHDLDSLHAACDRIAVLSQQQVLVVGPLAEVAQTDDSWIQSYFAGPRGRAAAKSYPTDDNTASSGSHVKSDGFGSPPRRTND